MSTSKTQQPEAPSNIELAREAGHTENCERQAELAGHPSLVVRQALARNRFLCADAIEVLGDELEALRAGLTDRIEGTLAE